MVDAGTGIDVAGLVETGITVSPDMAGGALVDRDGTVVGLLTYASDPGASGLAIPVASVRDVEDQLDSTGSRARWSTGGWACCARRTTPTGPAAARRSTTCTPAARPRRRVWWPATWWCERPATRSAAGPSWWRRCRTLRPQDPLDLQYVRGGRTHTLTIALGAGDPQLLATWPWPAMG